MPGLCHRSKEKKSKALAKGIKKVEDQLDVVKLIQQARAFKTLLTLLLSKNERYLLRVQRRHILLNHKQSSSDEDKKSDYSVIQHIKNLNFYDRVAR